MSEDTPSPPEQRSDECSTTDSFRDHGIGDGVDLITQTYYHLREADQAGFTHSERFFVRLDSAFLGAYLGTVDESGVPLHVELAIEDALALTEETFADRPDADLRTVVIPVFYSRVAGFHCIYRE